MLLSPYAHTYPVVASHALLFHMYPSGVVYFSMMPHSSSMFGSKRSQLLHTRGCPRAYTNTRIRLKIHIDTNISITIHSELWNIAYLIKVVCQRCRLKRCGFKRRLYSSGITWWSLNSSGFERWIDEGLIYLASRVVGSIVLASSAVCSIDLGSGDTGSIALAYFSSVQLVANLLWLQAMKPQ